MVNRTVKRVYHLMTREPIIVLIIIIISLTANFLGIFNFIFKEDTIEITILKEEGKFTYGNITFLKGAILDNYETNILRVTGSLNVTGNISQGDDDYHCFGDNCEGYMVYNSTGGYLEISGS